MIFGEKVGIGIVTYNRKVCLQRLIESLILEDIDEIVIINDGEWIDPTLFKTINLINNESNIGVGRSKNKAINYLFERDVEHFFIIEDDLFIKKMSVFKKYIYAAKMTGIQHFNYALHGKLNVDDQNKAKIKIQLSFQDINISFYKHCVGAFSYFSRRVIQEVGLYDEYYFNALEHLDHTYRICQQNFHPNFWYFADIENSSTYIGDDGWCETQSVIATQNNCKDNLKKAEQYFFSKYNISIYKIKEDSILNFINKVELINGNYGIKKDIFSLNKAELSMFIRQDARKQFKCWNISRLIDSSSNLCLFYIKSMFLYLK